MSADTQENPDNAHPPTNDTLPFEMGGDARVTADHDTLPLAPVDMPTIGHIGRYVLKFRVGQGGLGTVFAAHDPLLSRLIAIKTVTPRVGNEERESFNTHFLNEARAAAGLSHPNIVTVFDAGVSPQGAYIAMELLKGRDLRQTREDGSLPTPAQAALIVRRVADALSYAHARGVVHCDIKPANIFMVSPTQPKVLDFGIARVMHPVTGEPGKHIGGGSPRYMAPEQLQGQDTDRRSDVYSLGVVLYELLTDTNPFGRSTLQEITDAVIEHVPTPAHRVAPGVPESLATIVSRAMAKNPLERYQSARVFSRELRRWLEGQLEGSQGRDTGTDPVGLTRPGGFDSAARHDAAVGAASRPSSLGRAAAAFAARAVSRGSGHEGSSADSTREGVKRARRKQAADADAHAALPRRALAATAASRGWTITGLAIVAVLAIFGAVWFSDGGISKPVEQTIASADTQRSRTGLGAAESAADSAARSADQLAAIVRQAGTEPMTSKAPASSPSLPDTSPAAADASRQAPAVVQNEAAAQAPADSAARNVDPDFGMLTESSADAGLPTVRLAPRVREDAPDTERPPARRTAARDPARDAPRDNARAGTRDAVPIRSRPGDSPGFARGDQHMAPVATAVPTRLGFVDIRANPAAEIEIDGNPGGTAAPYARLRMTEGVHIITLYRDGHPPRRIRVNVSEGRPVTVAHNFR